METYVQPKRTRLEESNNIANTEPSLVIHARHLPQHTVEFEIIQVFQSFGEVREVVMMPHQKQALIEFVELSAAEACVDSVQKAPLRIGDQDVHVAFSSSKRIFQRAGDKHSPCNPDEITENHVLLFTFYNVNYPITIDVIRRITSPYANIVRIVMFRKTQLQAMVEFNCIDDARLVKRNINGADIYSGCCTVKVDYARPTRLSVTRNDADSWDFENPSISSPPVNVQSQGKSLLGDNSIQQYDSGFSNGHVYQPQTHHTTPPQFPAMRYLGSTTTAGRCLIDYPQPMMESTLTEPVSFTPVAMIHNLNMDRINCDRLFNLLCPYGNVLRIRFLFTQEGCAMVEMGDAYSVDRLAENLSGRTLMDSQLLVTEHSTLRHKNSSECFVVH